jgi:class 3 adenylate cyclase
MDQGQSVTRGFLFADLRDYTRFVESRGDHAAADLIAAYRVIVREVVARTDGSEVKTEGDSFFVVFPSASSAVLAGLEIVDATARHGVDHTDQPIAVGIGIHAGETVRTDEGFVGSVVNMAARICSQAGAGEVLVSDTVRSLTRTFLDVSFESVGVRQLKGVSEPVALFRVHQAGATTPRRSRRRPARRIGVVVALIVGVVAIPIVVVTLLQGGRSASEPTAGPVGGAGGASPSPSVTVSNSVAFPNALEADLLSRLPPQISADGTCDRSDPSEATAGAVVSVHCDLRKGSGADEVWFDLLDPPDQAITSYVALATGHRLGEGDCASARDVYGPWQLKGFLSGGLACYEDEQGAWEAWSYDAQGILARAVRKDGDGAALNRWWAQVGPFLLR